jgi:RHS repeat-associated protein
MLEIMGRFACDRVDGGINRSCPRASVEHNRGAISGDPVAGDDGGAHLRIGYSGPIGAPLVLNGSDFGDGGDVWFFPYKNGALDPHASPVEAMVTQWTPSQLSLKVPSGALTGLVQVVSGDQASNPLPFVVTSGTYLTSCSTTPSSTQLQITTDSLPDGAASHSYSVQLNATGGSNSYTWSLISGSLPAGLSLSSSGVISGTPSGPSSPVNLTVQVIDTSTPQQHDEAILSLEVAAQPEAGSSGALYNFSIQTGVGASGYDGVGNVIGYTDSVNGTWLFSYDSLNRVAAGTGSQDDNPYPNFCWNYDPFGNRWMQMSANVPFTSGMGGPNQGSNVCSSTGGVGQTNAAQYNDSSNRISDGLQQYDLAGNLIADSTTNNSYLYDGEGRICAMEQSIAGITTMTQYLYDAEGNRVAKGLISAWSCDTTSNGFTATTTYVLGPNGEQMTELTNNSGTWQFEHTNVYAPGLSATFDADLTGQTEGRFYFHLSDWLGTRRQQTDYAGNPCLNFIGQPFGDGLMPIPVSNADCDDATEHHFTGKERDTESGNDYFGARYFASTMGRFLSPDWSAKAEPVPYAKLDDPQSLNLYSYVRNNPLSRVDADGHYELNASGCGDNSKCQKKYDKAANKFEARREKDLNSKKEAVRTAAANYGARGEANGVHVGFADLSSQHIDGSVDPSGSTPGNQNIQVTLDFSRAGSAETQTHEGTHVGDDQKFLNSYDPTTGGYNQNLNPTHFQTEFNAFKAGAYVNHEHGFGPNDTQKITDYINTNYPARILNMPVFNPANFPAEVPDDEQ